MPKPCNAVCVPGSIWSSLKILPTIIFLAILSSSDVGGPSFNTIYFRHETFSAQFRDPGVAAVDSGLFIEPFRLNMKNRRRVENLAVLIDHHDVMPLEEWVCEFLRGFGNVQNLTLVIEHHQEDHQDKSCLNIMDKPVDYYEYAFPLYNRFHPDPSNEHEICLAWIRIICSA